MVADFGGFGGFERAGGGVVGVTQEFLAVVFLGGGVESGLIGGDFGEKGGE